MISYPHEAEQIRRLQNGHANHIESIYHSLATLPGNPDQVCVKQIGQTRTFIAKGWRLENRAILTGNESFPELDEVMKHFADHKSNCVIEINPANFYRSQPFSWDAEVVPHLLKRGCYIDMFRCVWQTFTPHQIKPPIDVDIRVLGSGEIEAYADLAVQVEGAENWDQERWRRVRYGESQPGWHHLIGFSEGRPCALAVLYVQEGLGYLAWGYTHPDYRRRGLHEALVARRLELAFELGCQCAFTVTDPYTQSARDLQRSGFHLSYNYLLLRREFDAEEHQSEK